MQKSLNGWESSTQKLPQPIYRDSIEHLTHLYNQLPSINIPINDLPSLYPKIHQTQAPLPLCPLPILKSSLVEWDFAPALVQSSSSQSSIELKSHYTSTESAYFDLHRDFFYEHSHDQFFAAMDSMIEDTLSPVQEVMSASPTPPPQSTSPPSSSSTSHSIDPKSPVYTQLRQFSKQIGELIVQVEDQHQLPYPIPNGYFNQGDTYTAYGELKQSQFYSLPSDLSRFTLIDTLNNPFVQHPPSSSLKSSSSKNSLTSSSSTSSKSTLQLYPPANQLPSTQTNISGHVGRSNLLITSFLHSLFPPHLAAALKIYSRFHYHASLPQNTPETIPYDLKSQDEAFLNSPSFQQMRHEYTNLLTTLLICSDHPVFTDRLISSHIFHSCNLNFGFFQPYHIFPTVARAFNTISTLLPSYSENLDQNFQSPSPSFLPNSHSDQAFVSSPMPQNSQKPYNLGFNSRKKNHEAHWKLPSTLPPPDSPHSSNPALLNIPSSSSPTPSSIHKLPRIHKYSSHIISSHYTYSLMTMYLKPTQHLPLQHFTPTLSSTQSTSSSISNHIDADPLSTMSQNERIHNANTLYTESLLNASYTAFKLKNVYEKTTESWYPTHYKYMRSSTDSNDSTLLSQLSSQDLPQNPIPSSAPHSPLSSNTNYTKFPLSSQQLPQLHLPPATMYCLLSDMHSMTFPTPPTSSTTPTHFTNTLPHHPLTLHPHILKKLIDVSKELYPLPAMLPLIATFNSNAAIRLHNSLMGVYSKQYQTHGKPLEHSIEHQIQVVGITGKLRRYQTTWFPYFVQSMQDLYNNATNSSNSGHITKEAKKTPSSMFPPVPSTHPQYYALSNIRSFLLTLDQSVRSFENDNVKASKSNYQKLINKDVALEDLEPLPKSHLPSFHKLSRVTSLSSNVQIHVNRDIVHGYTQMKKFRPLIVKSLSSLSIPTLIDLLSPQEIEPKYTIPASDSVPFRSDKMGKLNETKSKYIKNTISTTTESEKVSNATTSKPQNPIKTYLQLVKQFGKLIDAALLHSSPPSSASSQISNHSQNSTTLSSLDSQPKELPFSPFTALVQRIFSAKRGDQKAFGSYSGYLLHDLLKTFEQKSLGGYTDPLLFTSKQQDWLSKQTPIPSQNAFSTPTSTHIDHYNNTNNNNSTTLDGQHQNEPNIPIRNTVLPYAQIVNRLYQARLDVSADINLFYKFNQLGLIHAPHLLKFQPHLQYPAPPLNETSPSSLLSSSSLTMMNKPNTGLASKLSTVINDMGPDLFIFNPAQGLALYEKVRHHQHDDSDSLSQSPKQHHHPSSNFSNTSPIANNTNSIDTNAPTSSLLHANNQVSLNPPVTLKNLSSFAQVPISVYNQAKQQKPLSPDLTSPSASSSSLSDSISSKHKSKVFQNQKMIQMMQHLAHSHISLSSFIPPSDSTQLSAQNQSTKLFSFEKVRSAYANHTTTLLLSNSADVNRAWQHVHPFLQKVKPNLAPFSILSAIPHHLLQLSDIAASTNKNFKLGKVGKYVEYNEALNLFHFHQKALDDVSNYLHIPTETQYTSTSQFPLYVYPNNITSLKKITTKINEIIEIAHDQNELIDKDLITPNTGHFNLDKFGSKHPYFNPTSYDINSLLAKNENLFNSSAILGQLHTNQLLPNLTSIPTTSIYSPTQSFDSPNLLFPRRPTLPIGEFHSNDPNIHTLRNILQLIDTNNNTLPTSSILSTHAHLNTQNSSLNLALFQQLHPVTCVVNIQQQHSIFSTLSQAQSFLGVNVPATSTVPTLSEYDLYLSYLNTFQPNTSSLLHSNQLHKQNRTHHQQSSLSTPESTPILTLHLSLTPNSHQHPFFTNPDSTEQVTLMIDLSQPTLPPDLDLLLTTIFASESILKVASPALAQNNIDELLKLRQQFTSNKAFWFIENLISPIIFNQQTSLYNDFFAVDNSKKPQNNQKQNEKKAPAIASSTTSPKHPFSELSSPLKEHQERIRHLISQFSQYLLEFTTHSTGSLGAADDKHLSLRINMDSSIGLLDPYDRSTKLSSKNLKANQKNNQSHNSPPSSMFDVMISSLFARDGKKDPKATKTHSDPKQSDSNDFSSNSFSPYPYPIHRGLVNHFISSTYHFDLTNTSFDPLTSITSRNTTYSFAAPTLEAKSNWFQRPLRASQLLHQQQQQLQSLHSLYNTINYGTITSPTSQIASLDPTSPTYNPFSSSSLAQLTQAETPLNFSALLLSLRESSRRNLKRKNPPTNNQQTRVNYQSKQVLPHNTPQKAARKVKSPTSKPPPKHLKL